VKERSSFSILHEDTMLFQDYLLKRLSPTYVFGPFVNGQMTVAVYFCLCDFYVFPSSLCLFLCQCHAGFLFLLLCSEYTLKSGTVIPPMLFLLRTTFAIQSLMLPNDIQE
jgi:hypothetical protein